MRNLTHWHIISDCAVMGSYTTKEQAENAVYEQMLGAVHALLDRWTRQLMDKSVITCNMADNEVESWLIDECDRPLTECDPVEDSPASGQGGRLGYLQRTDDEQWCQ